MLAETYKSSKMNVISTYMSSKIEVGMVGKIERSWFGGGCFILDEQLIVICHSVNDSGG